MLYSPQFFHPHGPQVALLTNFPRPGRPSDEDIAAIQSPFAQDMLESLPAGAPMRLGTIFPVAPPDALDLLGKLLQFNPAKRITVEEALRHPFVRQFHNPSTEPNAPSVISIPVNDNKKVHPTLTEWPLQSCTASRWTAIVTA